MKTLRIEQLTYRIEKEIHYRPIYLYHPQKHTWENSRLKIDKISAIRAVLLLSNIYRQVCYMIYISWAALHEF